MTTEIYHQLCQYLKSIIQGTEWEGHLFAVGGCCRDMMLGFPIKDLDLAVDLPDGGVRFARWLEKRHLVAGRATLFKRFGTARVVLRNFRDIELEIVQTRRSRYTAETDSNPALAFGSIEDDSYRRDLTINTLFYDISRDKLLDPTGMGIDDIKSLTLRTPLPPDQTLEDDPLRLMRIIRFAMRYGQPITDPALIESMKRYAPELDTISRERLHREFDRILESPDTMEAIRLLIDVGALQHILPELYAIGDETINGDMRLFDHTLLTLEKLLEINPDAPLPLRLAALFHNLGKPASRVTNNTGNVSYPNHETLSGRAARQIMRRLRYERDEMGPVQFYLDHQGFCSNRGERCERLKDRQLRRVQLDCDEPARFNLLLDLIKADLLASGLPTEGIDNVAERNRRMIENGDAMFNYSLPVDPQQIAKAMRCRTEGELEKIIARIRKVACSNPRRDTADILREAGVDLSKLKADTPHRQRRRRKRSPRKKG